MSILQDRQTLTKLSIIRDPSGNNLLQVAVKNKKKEAFDYLLSLPNFPLNGVNDNNETALMMSLSTTREERGVLPPVKKYFAAELIKHGADIHSVNRVGDNLLHMAIMHRDSTSAILLMQRGIDLNAWNSRGYTPLHLLLKSRCCKQYYEIAAALLFYGADPKAQDSRGVDVFHCALSCTRRIGRLIEQLYYYVFDELERYEIDLRCLMQLALIRSPVFERIIELDIEVFVKETNYAICFIFLLEMNVKYLRIFLEKFGELMREVVLRGSTSMFLGKFYWTQNSQYIVNLSVLLESHVSRHLIDFFTTLNCALYGSTTMKKISEAQASDLVLFLLSYGMNLHQVDLAIVYNDYGYGELFQYLLMMDIEWDLKNDSVPMCILPVLVSNVALDIHEIIENNSEYSDIHDLVYHFAHPKVKSYLLRNITKGPRFEKIHKLPRVPLLKEFARDAFRKFFVQKFDIKNSRQFYTLLKQLPTYPPIKEIISFRRILYNV
jgi:hypothetical protein